MTSSSPLQGALEGVRVLDLTQNLPGPYGTQILASLGADVLKVEPPGGETARGVPAFFALVNRGKKSVVIDLGEERGRKELRELAYRADVLVEGFRPGVLEGWGLAPPQLRSANPGLVVARISGFGQSGPYRSFPSHDLNLQALTGVCHMARDESGRPVEGALPIADLSAGMTAAMGILAALFRRERTGEGATLDIALSDAIHSWAHVWAEGLTPTTIPVAPPMRQAAQALNERAPRVAGFFRRVAEDPALRDRAERVVGAVRATAPVANLERKRLRALPHYRIYSTADRRHLAVGIVDEGKFWRALCAALDRPRLARIPLAARAALGSPIGADLARVFRTRTLEEWLDILPRESIPVTPVLTVSEAARDPHLLTRQIAAHGGPVVPFPLATDLPPAPPLGSGKKTRARWLSAAPR